MARFELISFLISKILRPISFVENWYLEFMPARNANTAVMIKILKNGFFPAILKKKIVAIKVTMKYGRMSTAIAIENASSISNDLRREDNFKNQSVGRNTNTTKNSLENSDP
jgi:hypothetical protein